MLGWLVGFFKGLNNLLHQPTKVLVLCVVTIFFSLIVEGSLFQLWNLHRDHREIKHKISKIKTENLELEMKIAKASDPSFLEFQARNQFNLVEEGDLVFIFSGQN